jgi:hypothetical protein
VHVLLVEELSLESSYREISRLNDNEEYHDEQSARVVTSVQHRNHLMRLGDKTTTSDDEVWRVAAGHNVSVLKQQQKDDKELVDELRQVHAVFVLCVV